MAVGPIKDADVAALLTSPAVTLTSAMAIDVSAAMTTPGDAATPCATE